MKLYETPLSGNCYKVRLFAALAGIDMELIPVDLPGGAHKQPEFLALNPLGQVPVLVDGDTVVRDAQAILVYLAGRLGGLAWWPAQPHGQAEIMQWLSFASNEVQHGLCAARLVDKFGMALDKPGALAKAASALEVLDQHLAEHTWLAMGRPTIADCAVYPYVVLAPEGGVALEGYGHVGDWVERVKALPGYLAQP
ncbi:MULTISPECIES: glutathione S-transferase family protein [unclassified Pseudomonas]|uniref:glutathione S-transferase family protein n=1 Tax=unclassified Pseudomonas TaxID=196821 RepID=UPI000BDDE550|nr:MULTISPECIES: glutathione S-transferase [unclassified Pseudomonas]PVZ20384.1 glutathione S-transferase [Pseudomonas sp. URIL14HWK12:I12]PVZ27450.1 glutathione S-transferase [Pseudomonas sp. URIL14HWK12:I10]PVZ38339.1 glutathione S-transferase [Pseudomonas sp. URIL14HWK12:I11]SNZ03751.1 glutathione S-transferase [Pseudomonas sp. URIL14HWK12:I9]